MLDSLSAMITYMDQGVILFLNSLNPSVCKEESIDIQLSECYNIPYSNDMSSCVEETEG